MPEKSGRESARFAGWLTILVLAATCGGTPSAPSSLAPSVPPAVEPGFQPGAYSLGIAGNDRTIPGPGVGQVWVQLCICLGNDCPTSMTVPVDVERVGDSFTMRAAFGTLRGTLVVRDGAADMTLQGTALQGQNSPSGMAVQGNEARMTGSVVSDREMGGTVSAGGIDLFGPRGSGACSPASWSLSAR